jgi:hypothetical protein
MARKLFIVAPGHAALYRTLCTALQNEPEVEVVYDRRSAAAAGRWDAEERREPHDVDEQILARGFAVVRLEQRPPEHNIRWSA